MLRHMVFGEMLLIYSDCLMDLRIGPPKLLTVIPHGK